MILENLDKMFPDADCELDYSNPFELLIAVVLSAQTTDKGVNKVTPLLFSKYGTPEKMMNANLEDIENIIRPLGLYKNKAKNIINLSKDLVLKFDGNVPNNRIDLESLSGVGRKTCNVILATIFNVPAIAVDTHVSRVAKRLKLADQDDDVLEIEKKLMAIIPKEKWAKFHHQMIFLGRYICHSKNPSCNKCLFNGYCRQ